MFTCELGQGRIQGNRCGGREDRRIRHELAPRPLATLVELDQQSIVQSPKTLPLARLGEALRCVRPFAPAGPKPAPARGRARRPEDTRTKSCTGWRRFGEVMPSDAHCHLTFP